MYFIFYKFYLSFEYVFLAKRSCFETVSLCSKNQLYNGVLKHFSLILYKIPMQLSYCHEFVLCTYKFIFFLNISNYFQSILKVSGSKILVLNLRYFITCLSHVIVSNYHILSLDYNSFIIHHQICQKYWKLKINL